MRRTERERKPSLHQVEALANTLVLRKQLQAFPNPPRDDHSTVNGQHLHKATEQCTISVGDAVSVKDSVCTMRSGTPTD